MHVDVHVRLRAQHTTSVVAFDQTEFSLDLVIFVDALDV